VARRPGAERNVEQHDVERPVGRGLERAVAVGHSRDAMALALEGAGEHLAQGPVVVDQEDVEPGCGLHLAEKASGPIKGC
jgi:hypothetical protein